MLVDGGRTCPITQEKRIQNKRLRNTQDGERSTFDPKYEMQPYGFKPPGLDIGSCGPLIELASLDNGFRFAHYVTHEKRCEWLSPFSTRTLHFR